MPGVDGGAGGVRAGGAGRGARSPVRCNLDEPDCGVIETLVAWRAPGAGAEAPNFFLDKDPTAAAREVGPAGHGGRIRGGVTVYRVERGRGLEEYWCALIQRWRVAGCGRAEHEFLEGRAVTRRWLVHPGRRGSY